MHVGAGAQASRRGARWKERLGSVGVGKLNLGRIGYPIGAVQAAFRPPQLHLRVEVDGEVVNGLDQPVLMVAIGNGTSVGGGAELTPEADAEDGRIDIMISRSVGPLAKLGYAVQVMRRTHLERDDVLQVRGTRCRCRARSSTAPRTARSPARSGSAPGGWSRRRTRWCCPDQLPGTAAPKGWGPPARGRVRRA